MIVRTLAEIKGTDRDVQSKTWNSQRLLLARDGQRFSLHETILYAGTETAMWYANHVEAVYCVGGEGELINDETGEVHRCATAPCTCSTAMSTTASRHTPTCAWCVSSIRRSPGRRCTTRPARTP